MTICSRLACWSTMILERSFELSNIRLIEWSLRLMSVAFRWSSLFSEESSRRTCSCFQENISHRRKRVVRVHRDPPENVSLCILSGILMAHYNAPYRAAIGLVRLEQRGASLSSGFLFPTLVKKFLEEKENCKRLFTESSRNGLQWCAHLSDWKLFLY